MGISLTKDQTLSLVKDTGGALSSVRLGLGWDAVKKGLFGRTREIDLDASAILISGDRLLETVYYGQLRSRDGAIVHTGDNLTGAGDGDDEQINIDLDRINPSVDKIVLVITSFSGQTFNDVENVFARVIDTTGPESEVARYNLRDGGNQTANIIAKLTRTPEGWAITALGTPASGKTPQRLTTQALSA